MKRKLISHDVFQSIKNKSLTVAEHELIEAEPILATALNTEHLKLMCFGADNVMYETCNGTYVHANYLVKNGKLKFENIEQLVIDEETENNAARTLISQLLDAVADGNKEKADQTFANFIQMPTYNRNLKEGFEFKTKDKKKKKDGKKDKKSRKAMLKFKFGKDKKLKEWAGLCKNFKEFSNYKQFGKILSESEMAHDDRGNVVQVNIPTTISRNEAKMLTTGWKTLDTDVKILRSGAKSLNENIEFCKAVATLKRSNALSDNSKMQEALEDIVSKYPGVLYLTQNELSVSIAEALSTVGASNYDDQTCDFMADAILRTAHDNYLDRVDKIVNLSGVKTDESSSDPYLKFKHVADSFFPSIDESTLSEMQVYVDLYEALRAVHQIADEGKNELLKAETATHLRELAAIIEQQTKPSLDVAVAAAEWLNTIVETNLESSDWDISNNVHITITGDHPKMSQNAKHGYTPSSDFSGDWGDTAPVSDGKSYKNGLADEMRSRSWGNLGGDGVYPSLSNPYIPKPFGAYEIDGEKTIDADSDQLGHTGGKDTWPNLSNPYLPSSETPKMKSDNLVVDK